MRTYRHYHGRRRHHHHCHHRQSSNSWFGAPGAPGLPGAPRAPGAPETLKLQVDTRSEMVWFAKGNEIHISDFCIANTMDIKYQL